MEHPPAGMWCTSSLSSTWLYRISLGGSCANATASISIGSTRLCASACVAAGWSRKTVGNNLR